MGASPGDQTWAGLAAIAATPLAVAADAAGDRPLVGLLGGGVPLEVVLATGCDAVAVPPDPHATYPLASRYLGPAAPRALAGRLERLLSGELSTLSLAIATSRFEIDALLYHSAKEILRRGEGGRLPTLHLFVLLGDQSPSAQAYTLGQARRLGDRLATLSGQTASATRLTEAVERLNALRIQAERLQALRFTGQVSGTTAMSAFAAMRSLPPEIAAARLAVALDEAATGPPRRAAPRLLVASSNELDHPDLHAALEAAGGHVVLEDGDWGARALGPQIQIDRNEDPLEAIVRSYCANTPGLAVHPHTLRHAWFYRQAARQEVDAVVFHIPLDEAPLGWDYPRLSAFTTQLGKPVLLVRADPLSEVGRSQIQQQARTFLQALPERRG